MANAIRRRKQTSELDYWNTLPSGPHAPRPLYRAVIRGALTADTAMCTLSSIVDAATEKEYSMVVKRNGYQLTGNGSMIHGKNVNVIRAEDMGLTINGLSLNDMKSKQQVSPSSPRINGEWKNNAAVCTKQRKISGQNNLKNGMGHNGSDYNNNSSTALEAGGCRSSKANVKPVSLPAANPKPPQRTPRLSLTTRPSHVELKETKRLPFSPRSESVNRKDSGTSIQLPKSYYSPRNSLIRQSSLPVTSANGSAPLSTSVESSLAKRKFSQEIDNSGKFNVASSFPSSTCLQFAESILGAMDGDLNQIYSICQAKVRYAEFIEQSQPHRLGEHDVANKASAKDVDNIISQSQPQNETTAKENKNPSVRKLSKETVSPPSVHPTTSPPPSPSPPQEPSSPTNTTASGTANNRGYPPFRLAPLTPRGNRTLAFREPNQDGMQFHLEKTHANAFESEPNFPRGKTTRPILKSSKTDIDTNVPPFRNYGDKTDTNNNNNSSSNNNNSNSNNNSSSLGNRLVRFKVNHEVREFAPSEPVRIS